MLQVLTIPLLMTVAFLSGCVFGGKKNEKSPMLIDGKPVVRFSDSQQAPALVQRKYQKMTRQKLEDESEIQANAGSLWVMEGQGAYLFSQNKTRKEGDMLNVKIEGAAQKQVEAKVGVIRKLLKQLEDEENKKRDSKDESKKTLAKNGDGNRAPASEAPAPQAAASEKEETLDLQAVPSKIVERLGDGTYRIRGQQPFMIGKREYKVLVTGLMRAEDFNDEGVSSSKIYESQYDVVSLRRKNE